MSLCLGLLSCVPLSIFQNFPLPEWLKWPRIGANGGNKMLSLHL